MSKKITETLVGVFVIIGIIIFIILYTWLSGRVSLRNSYDVTVYFDDVTGLRVGDPVMFYGLEKGKVKSLQIDSGGVRTILAVDRDIKIPEDSKIEILSINLLGTDRYIKITPGEATTISSVYRGQDKTLDIESIAAQFDSLLIMVKGIELPDFNKVTTDFSRSIDKTTQNLSAMLKGPSAKIEGLIVKLDSISMMFKEDGTIGKLLESDEFYEEIRETNQALKNLIEDIKENPKRYINIKVF